MIIRTVVLMGCIVYRCGGVGWWHSGGWGGGVSQADRAILANTGAVLNSQSPDHLHHYGVVVGLISNFTESYAH